jgi:hypothetical protein
VEVNVPESLHDAKLGASRSTFTQLSKDPNPPNALVPIRGMVWMVPATAGTLEGVQLESTHLAFVEDRIAVVHLEATGTGCRSLRAALEKRFGSPSSENDAKAIDDSVWSKEARRLSYRSVHFTDRSEEDRCAVSLSDEAAFTKAFVNQGPPPVAKGLDHFGNAKLGARRSDFPGLTFKERKESTEWYEVPTRTYQGVPLDRHVYSFQDGRLVNVSFGVAAFSDCSKALALLKKEYGTPAEKGNLGGGLSYEWESPEAKLTFNGFKDSCNGILFATH